MSGLLDIEPKNLSNILISLSILSSTELRSTLPPFCRNILFVFPSEFFFWYFIFHITLDALYTYLEPKVLSQNLRKNCFSFVINSDTRYSLASLSSLATLVKSIVWILPTESVICILPTSPVNDSLPGNTFIASVTNLCRLRLALTKVWTCLSFLPLSDILL